MDWGDVAAVAAVVVAAAALLITLRQASDGRKSRTATEQQAAEATKTREIADEALAIAKQTEADRLADRDARDAPVFEIVPKGRSQIRVTMTEGPPEVAVRMARLDVVAKGVERLGVPVGLALDAREHQLAPGGTCLMDVDVRIEKASCTVRIELRSNETDGDRVWLCRREVRFPPPAAVLR